EDRRPPQACRPLSPQSAARPGGRQRSLRQLDGERRRRLPDIAVLEGPRIGQSPLARAVDEAGCPELARGPDVELVEPRDDHGVVEQPAEPELALAVRLDTARERVLRGQYP